MKIGAENKKQLRWMVGLLAVALIVGIYNLVDFGTSSAAPPVTTATTTQKKSTALQAAAQNSLDPRLWIDILTASQNKKYEAGRNIFRMEEAPIPTALANGRPTTPQIPIGPPTPTPPPPPPPINVKFYGFASKPNEPKRIFLADEGEVFIARQGDIIERKYKVIQINNTSVVIEDVLNNNRQPIQLTAK